MQATDSRHPDPPIDVRLILKDGSELAVDTVYVGFEDGQHMWMVVNGPPHTQIRGLKIQRLPSNTSVSVPITGGNE